jgi:hypothetical protein
VGDRARGGRAANRPASERITKAERREAARIEREEIQARMARRRRSRTASLVVGLVLAAGVIALVIFLGGSDDGTEPDTSALPGLMTSPAPWGANTDEVVQRDARLDLPPFLDQAGVGTHHHIRLFLFVHGKQEVVPANIAVVNGGAASPIHTHDDTGTVHVESSIENYIGDLGLFFDVWGLRLSSDCLGAYCTQGDDALRAFVNGEPFEGDPRTIPLADQSAIVVTFGTEDELPDPMPNTFTFGA